jgi:nickel-dependent lactate racemase
VQQVRLEYADGGVVADLPDDAVVVQPGEAAHEPPGLSDPVAATRDAIRHPIGTKPLPELVGPGSRVTIAFPDRVKGGGHATAHRRVTIPILVGELEGAGVHRRDITLVCAIGLHRKNTNEEFAAYLGREILDMFEPEQIVNHDAEDLDGIVTLEPSDLGDVVEMNRLLVDSDLTILISHAAGNPYGGFSGGYKMPSTGLTTWRSIRCHHTPGSLHRSDFVPISTGSRFRDQLAAIGRRMESAMPQPFFTVDAVLNARSEQVAVVAGTIPAVEQATWQVATHRTELTVAGEPADVLVLGVPRNFHYGNGMGSNPILMMQAIGASLLRANQPCDRTLSSSLRQSATAGSTRASSRPTSAATNCCRRWTVPLTWPGMRRRSAPIRSMSTATDACTATTRFTPSR